jgi:Amt family ammonium transporter
VCYGAVLLKERWHYDDSLDAFGVHGVGGILGALLTGGVRAEGPQPGGADGLLAGNPAQLGKQLVGVVVVGAYSALLTFGLLKLVDRTMGLRAAKDDELEGLDASQHGESGYVM